MSRVEILDGATGTMLQKAGMKTGEIPELLNIKNPEMIKSVYEKYANAGSDIVYACTFGANRIKMDRDVCVDVIERSTKLCHDVCNPKGARVALDIGPIGEMLEPMGTLKYEEAIDIFKEIINAGKKYSDLIVIETMTDLLEVKAAVIAARESCDLPIFVTMTFEPDTRTFAGVSLETFVNMCDGLGVSAIGMNCSLGPFEMYDMAKRLSEITTLDLIIKPNAGLPDMDGNYNVKKEDFVDKMVDIYELGFRYFGGCCGTNEEFIKLLAKRLKGRPVKERSVSPIVGASSGTKFVSSDSFRIVGERINPTGKKACQHALKEGDLSYFVNEAISQVDEGADILDINAGYPGIDEADMQAKIVKNIQSVLDTPLQIDSTKPEALEAALRVYNGKAIVNSVNGEDEKLQTILPIVKKYNAQVIGLLLDENGIPQTAEERLVVAEKIVSHAEVLGIKRHDIYIDCLTLTVSSEPESVKETLRTIELVKKELGVKTVLGVSNISYGMPNRDLINATFLTLAMASGLDMAIINPASTRMIDAINAYNLLANKNFAVENFVDKYSRVKISEREVTGSYDISDAVYKGLKDNVKNEVKRLLDDHTELEIIDNYLIPALDRVGDDYGSGKIFLPQLIKSADAAQSGLKVIREHILKSGKEQISKGDIIVATVKGDIHDIGKNIAKVILENYGYNVIDLGRDVLIDDIINTAREKNVKLIGLSALMTTTLENMKQTIMRIRKELPDRVIMVGGAVLTEDYARAIDAEFYLKDAKRNIEVAREVFGE